MKKYFFAAFVSLLYVPAVTFLSELLPPFKDFLKNVFWHHWLGKSIILPILFFATVGVLHQVMKKNDGESAAQYEKYIVGIIAIAILGGLSVFAFFVYEYLAHAA